VPFSDLFYRSPRPRSACRLRGRAFQIWVIKDNGPKPSGLFEATREWVTVEKPLAKK
jgi:hypothetical protein